MDSSLILPKKLKKAIDDSLHAIKFKLTLDQIIKYILLISLFLSIVILLLFFKENIKLASNFTIALITYFILSYLISIVICVFSIYSVVVIKKVKRKNEIENVLADYLQIVAANLNAGMPIDQALWYAVRERFGVLAEEIELLAKKVMGGVDLEAALLEFGKSYDSDLLDKSVILLIEGLKSGGELSSLVNNIAWNIKETQLLEKEIAAETTTYSVFIIFASLFAAPALYSLAHRIILIMGSVIGKIDTGSLTGITTPLPLSLSSQAITSGDFKVFAIVNLVLTAAISAMIISKIKKGGIKPGLRLIPFFIAIAVILFLLLIVILNGLFKGFVI